jgi:heme exporter protein D
MTNWFLIGTTIATLIVFAIDTVQGRRQNLRRK